MTTPTNTATAPQQPQLPAAIVVPPTYTVGTVAIPVTYRKDGGDTGACVLLGAALVKFFM